MKTVILAGGYSTRISEDWTVTLADTGLETMTDDSLALYFVTQYYTPGAEKGYRWDDPAFNIEWPMRPVVVSDKDRGWPLV